MSTQRITITVFRYDPSIDHEPHYQSYEVPKTEGMSLLETLDYVYEQLDGSLAYYDHAVCQHGICGRCTLMIDGKPTLVCQALVQNDMIIEPLHKSKVVRDLVISERE